MANHYYFVQPQLGVSILFDNLTNGCGNAYMYTIQKHRREDTHEANSYVPNTQLAKWLRDMGGERVH